MRTGQPPVYNAKRLYEQPIPVLDVPNDYHYEYRNEADDQQFYDDGGQPDVGGASNYGDETPYDVDEEQDGIVQAQNYDGEHGMFDEHGPNNDRTPNMDVNYTPPQVAVVYVPAAVGNPLDTEMKMEIDPLQLDEQAEAELYLALNDDPSVDEFTAQATSDDNDDDEIIFSGDVPMPKRNEIVLTKQEDDCVSGNLPFAAQVRVFSSTNLFFVVSYANRIITKHIICVTYPAGQW